MPLHYTKSGNLDMRYSSSKAAVASGYSSGGYSSESSSHTRGSASYCGGSSGYMSGGYTSGNSSYGSSSQGGLHYKKDGTLDMRYTSSRETVSSASPSSYCSSRHNSTYGNTFSGCSSNLHYKKDGTLDMRYSSSKEAVTSASSSSSSSGIHLKKDGTPDMRFRSSREMPQLDSGFRGMRVSPKSELHLKKDGTLDMRFTSSKLAVGNGSVAPQTRCIPSSIPLTKSGLPDMRTAAAKLWVEEQGRNCSPESVPLWVPRRKDGTVDTTKAVTRAFFDGNRGNITMPTDHTLRIKYYEKKLLDVNFRLMVDQARQASIYMPQPYKLPNTEQLRSELYTSAVSHFSERAEDIQQYIPSSIPLLDYAQLKASFPDEEKATLGKGCFGVVLKGLLGTQEVAVKRLHLNKLTKKENRSFVKELVILAMLGDHPNLVKLFGYTLEPPCLVMEYVKLGSLSQLLHYSEDPAIEAKLTDGRIKKLLIVGVVDGMRQLHAAGIVHGDLKPANVLITSDYVAKVSDFGLSTLRGKTSSTVASTVKDDGETAVAGTAGYMAPELLDGSKRPQLSCDVYSFAVLLNEVIHEEEPYYGQYDHFQGRGPFAAVLYAKNGNRPFLNKSMVPRNLQALIETCWNAIPDNRPTFEEISAQLQKHDLKIPNSFS